MCSLILNIVFQNVNVTLTSSATFELEVLYASAAISQAEVEVILSHFETVLRSLVQNPAQLLSDIDLVNDAEKMYISSCLVKGESELHPAQGAHELFETQALRTPKKIAVRSFDILVDI